MTSSREHISIVQLHLKGCLIGRFPIYIGKRPIRQPLRWNPIKHQITTNLMHIDTQSNDKLKIAYLYRKAIWYLWTNLVPIEFKNTQLEQNQNHKGFPFENFLRELSTNEKPAFSALDQWEASISARFWTFSKLWAIQSTANWPFLYGSSNGVWFYFQWNVNCLPIECYLTVIWMSINCQLNSNWLQM